MIHEQIGIADVCAQHFKTLVARCVANFEQIRTMLADRGGDKAGAQ